MMKSSRLFSNFLEKCCCFTKKKALYSTIYSNWGSYEYDKGVRCNLLCKANNELIATPSNRPDVNTVWELFNHGVEVSGSRNCLGWRVDNSYHWLTFNEVYSKVQKLSTAFAKMGFERTDKIGIYSQCRPDWVITALAATSRSLIVVPLYDTLGVESCAYIINQVEMPILFTDSSASASKILGNIEATRSLTTLVMFSEPDDSVIKLAEDKPISLLTLDQFLLDGKGKANEAFEPDHVDRLAQSKSTLNDSKNSLLFSLPTPDDIFIIMYTSGTTGNPKGVIHKHSALVANILGCDSSLWADFGHGNCFSNKDVGLQFLPLAHAYGLGLQFWFLYRGAAMGFFGGNVMKLMEDACILKPTFIPMVPRLMNRLYSKVVSELEKNKTKQHVFWHAFEKKKRSMINGRVTRNSIWDKIVFNKIQAQLGGRVWLITVGSAPVSAEILEFCRVTLGTVILEGYGQTECAAAASVAVGPHGGNVGHPLPCNLIKLDDVPDCGYSVEDGRGEVCIKGPNVMVGYFKQPDKTAEVLDADGWLHTGDIGELQSDGSLKIIDRKKNIFKLSQGEYISPEKIENVYALCSKVHQVFVDGSSLENYAVAIVVPDPTLASNYASVKGISILQVMEDKDFIKLVYDAMVIVGKERKLNSLEQVKSIGLTSEPFTIENGLLTPTLKNKRPELRKLFKEQVEALYKNGPFA